MWFADLITNKTLVKLGLYVNSLSYLKDKLSHFINLPDYVTKESNSYLIRLNIAITMVDNNR